MQTIVELLNPRRSHLLNLLQRANPFKITKKLRTLLPHYLADHCVVAAWENEKIIVHSTNAAAGTVLRYQLPHILPLLQKDEIYREITQVICHIRPPLIAEKENAHIKPRIKHSAYAVSLVNSIANNISTTSVQEALNRLAKSISNN